MAVHLETGKSIWSKETSKTIAYSHIYATIPAVQLTILEASDGIPNVYLTSVTTTSFTINTSAEFTGFIFYSVMSRPVCSA